MERQLAKCSEVVPKVGGGWYIDLVFFDSGICLLSIVHWKIFVFAQDNIDPNDNFNLIVFKGRLSTTCIVCLEVEYGIFISSNFGRDFWYF